MKTSLLAIAAALALLSGCAALESAGHTGYSAEFTPIGCRINVADGKEFKRREIAVDCHKGQFSVREEEARAFRGQALAVKAVNVLPTMGLQDILAPRDK